MAGELCETKSRAGISATGFFYSDIPPGNPSIQSHLMHQIQGYVSNSEMFNTSTGMDQMIGFSKNMEQQSNVGNTAMWKSFTGKPGSQPGSSTSRLMPESTADYYLYHDQFNKDNQFATAVISEPNSENLTVGPHDDATWQAKRINDSSMRYMIPCERNERPNRGGLSLSLSSSNPTSISLQSLGIRHANHHQDQQDAVSSISIDHQGLYEKSGNTQQQQQLLTQLDWFVGKAATNANQGHCFLKNSKYLIPARELLSEFCSLGTNQTDQQKQKLHKNRQLEEGNGSVSSRRQSLNSLEFAELQRRKLKLLSMLEEVDRRYRHYCNQMKAVVSSFEAVAGNGSATVYSALASKAMSRHFRCLKDGILNQIKVTKKAMGEKDPVAHGRTRGETPRLRVIDQTLRQQRAFQQMSMMERHPWRPQRGLPERAVSFLRAWLFEHFLHPYPSDVDKHILARQTGLSRSQVSNWFINARVRLWKPMVEEMYFEETKEQENNMASSDGFGRDDIDDSSRPIHTPPSTLLDDQKPTPDQLVRVDSECLSSVVNNKPDHINNSRISCDVLPTPHLQSRPHERVGESAYGSIELDFTSYDQPSGPMVSYATNNANQSFNGGGVSLTLGLHQHGGSGVSSVFAPATQNSMFYPREQMQECHPVQYSILDGETQNLTYRNWMGAQLLPDLAG